MKQIEVDALKEKLDKIPARNIENADRRAYVLIRLSTVFEVINQMSPAQPEPAIPLSWIDEQIESLKGMDNAFATLTAMQISGMVKKWRGEQNETD